MSIEENTLTLWIRQEKIDLYLVAYRESMQKQQKCRLMDASISSTHTLYFHCTIIEISRFDLFAMLIYLDE